MADSWVGRRLGRCRPPAPCRNQASPAPTLTLDAECLDGRSIRSPGDLQMLLVLECAQGSLRLRPHAAVNRQLGAMGIERRLHAFNKLVVRDGRVHRRGWCRSGRRRRTRGSLWRWRRGDRGLRPAGCTASERNSNGDSREKPKAMTGCDHRGRPFRFTVEQTSRSISVRAGAIPKQRRTPGCPFYHAASSIRHRCSNRAPTWIKVSFVAAPQAAAPPFSPANAIVDESAGFRTLFGADAWRERDAASRRLWDDGRPARRAPYSAGTTLPRDRRGLRPDRCWRDLPCGRARDCDVGRLCRCPIELVWALTIPAFAVSFGRVEHGANAGRAPVKKLGAPSFGWARPGRGGIIRHKIMTTL
jgi:hypothetical protein